MSEEITSHKSISRRGFLKLGCASAAVVGLTVCGLSAATPDPAHVEFNTYTYGGDLMKNQILVAYASAMGSTVEVAAAIGETLAENGSTVEVRPVQEILKNGGFRANGYQAVVIGSAVQHGNWLPEAIDFVEANKQELNRLPVALFCVHITNMGEDETSKRNRLAYLNTVRLLLQPVSESYFPGKFDRRGAALLLPGILARFIPTMDLRNWKVIRAWARSIHPMLVQQV